MEREAIAYSIGGGVPYLINEEDYARLNGARVELNNDPVGYLRLGDGQLLHRWILGLEIGDPRIGDHVNRNVLDNRMSNLRIVTPTESNYNRRAWNKAGLPAGVKLQPSGRYVALLAHQGRRYYLGTHDTVEQAVEARERQLSEISGAP